jgi:hypothetical protein
MSEAFDAYTQANGRMKAAEESANRIVVELKRVFGPIFTNWKGCYLNGLERQIPIVLARRRKRLHSQHMSASPLARRS